MAYILNIYYVNYISKTGEEENILFLLLFFQIVLSK